MKETTQWIKKIGLFLFGIFLVVWGYKANAANNEKAKTDAEPEAKEAKSSLFGTIEANHTKSDTTINQTVIESANQPEEATGTQ